jgi:hypothetical protein
MMTFSITHFNSEEFLAYKKMHEDENTKIHHLTISFFLDRKEKEKYFYRYETSFSMRTVVKEDVKSGKLEIMDEIFEKFKTQEPLIFEIIGYSGKVTFCESDLEAKCENFLVKGICSSVKTLLERKTSSEIQKTYCATVYGEWLNTSFEKEKMKNDKKI